MLINAERQPADQDAGDLCDPTQYAPRDRRPYWNEDIASFSAAVWLPTGTADRGAAINRPHGWSSKTAAHSWFSTSRMTTPEPVLPGLYSPAAVQSKTVRTTAGASKQQSRRIQVYPDSAQKLAIATWLTASRWTYNLTAEILQSGIPAVWKHSASMVMPEVKALHPEWDSVPCQVKHTAVRDACRAMSNVKTFNLELKDSQAQGNRADETFAQLGYRSRQNPKQSCLHSRRRRDGAWRLSTPFWDRCGWPKPSRRSTKNADWCRSAASTGSLSLTRRNATLRPQAVMA